MSAVNPSIALLELLERRVRRRNNAFRRRPSWSARACSLR
jgi:hypothetical protein